MLGSYALASAPLGSLEDTPMAPTQLQFTVSGSMLGAGVLLGSSTFTINEGDVSVSATVPISATTAFGWTGAATMRTYLAVVGTASLNWAIVAQGHYKHAILGTSSLALTVPNAVITQGIGSTLNIPVTFTASATGIRKNMLFGTSALEFAPVGQPAVSIPASGAFGWTTAGQIKGTANAQATVPITWASSANLMSKQFMSGATGSTFSGSAELLEFNYDAVLNGFDPVTDANPLLFLYIPHTPNSFMLIQTLDTTSGYESVYAAIINKQTQAWSRIHLWSGNSEFPSSVEFSGGFDGVDFFCSVQITNATRLPQLVRNLTYTFNIVDGKLIRRRHPFFDRTFALPSDFWRKPYPEIIDANGTKYAIWRSTESQMFELYRLDSNWQLVEKTLNEAPLRISSFEFFLFSAEYQVFVIGGNGGNIYFSSNGYDWAAYIP